jgi:hypothetical protein
MKKFVLVSALMLGFAGSAFAGSCPTLAAKAEEALKTATLDDAGKAKVTELIATGKAEHEAGKHTESEAALNEALKMLGVTAG